jgi:hypothetical protein
MAPVNIAGQPIQIVEELRRQGIDARLLQYSSGNGHAFGYREDKIVNLLPNHRDAQIATLKSCLGEGYDIYHFWLRSLFYHRLYNDFLGLDLPFIKARGKRIIYRFTGFDLRVRSEDMRKNPYSVFHYGFDLGFNEEMQKKYIAFLQEYVDEFIVQDPEMHDFFPRAKIVPRVIHLDAFQYVGVEKTDCPIILHAPSIQKAKGSEFIEAAIKDLKSEGLCFTYKPIVGMKNEDAIKWYKKADIIVDQLHVGWYGVVTLEAMALGKPVVVYIRQELLDKYEHRVPIQNANPDTIKGSLRELIKDFDKRAELGRLSRKYVEEVHDVKKVVPKLIGIYEDVLAKEPVFPQTFADIDYYAAQLDLLEKKRTVARNELWHRVRRFRYIANKKRKILHKIVQAFKRSQFIVHVYETKFGKKIRHIIKTVLGFQ